MTHYLTSSYQGDSDTVGGATPYTGAADLRLDIPLGGTISGATIYNDGSAHSGVTSSASLAVVVCTSAHNLLTGASIALGGSWSGGSHSPSASPPEITKIDDTTFSYVTSGASGVGTGGTITINYQKVVVSITRSRVVSGVMQSDVPCTVNANSSGGSGGIVTLAGSLATTGGAPKIYPQSTITSDFSADITALYLVNGSSPSASGSFKLRFLLST